MNLLSKAEDLSLGRIKHYPDDGSDAGVTLVLNQTNMGGYTSFQTAANAEALTDAQAASGLAGGFYNALKFLAQAEDALNTSLAAGSKLDSFSFQEGTAIQTATNGDKFLTHTATVRIRVPVTSAQPVVINI